MQVSILMIINLNRDLTDKPNRSRNRIDSESEKESKGDITISVVDTANCCYDEWGSKWNSIAKVSDRCLFIYLLYLPKF